MTPCHSLIVHPINTHYYIDNNKSTKKREYVTMLKPYYFLLILLPLSSIEAAESRELTSEENQCIVHTMDKRIDTIEWAGTCTNGYAQGNGTIKEYVKGQLTNI